MDYPAGTSAHDPANGRPNHNGGDTVTNRQSQRKGRLGELEAAAMLSKVFGCPVKRMAAAYLPGLIAPDVFGLPGIHCEIKRRERVALPAALRQAKFDAGERVACVVHRGNRCPWMVTIQLEDSPAFARAIASLSAHLPTPHPDGIPG
jgi:hypothetical protein